MAAVSVAGINPAPIANLPFSFHGEWRSRKADDLETFANLGRPCFGQLDFVSSPLKGEIGKMVCP
jgi:hypothetical protein